MRHVESQAAPLVPCMERRVVSAGAPLQLRADGDTAGIDGYAALFDTESEDLGGFIETIAPGAFDDVLDQDVRALFNHDESRVLGRTASKTLRLTVDRTGLLMSVDLPDTQTGAEVRALVERGDVSGQSFSFHVSEDVWTFTDDDKPDRRIIKRISELRDVGPVTYPAYPATDVQARNLDVHAAAVERHKAQAAGGLDAIALRAAERARELDLAAAEM